jgi:hypothetical protein
MLHKVMQALLPCFTLDMKTSSGRHSWADLVLNDLGQIVGWAPYIIVMCVASTNEEAALWGAFGSMTALIALGVYRHSYAPKYPLVAWLDGGQWVGFLALAITWEATRFNYKLISPISTSVLLITTFVSMVVCKPFTIQYARLKVDDKVAASSGFLKFNHILTSVWLVVFLVMSVCTWLAWALHDDIHKSLSSTGYLILGTIVPILLPFVGALSMAPLSKYLAAKRPTGTTAASGSTDGESASGVEAANVSGSHSPSNITMV